MALIANETMPSPPGERPFRIVTVPDRFWSRFWAVLVSALLHPLSDTIIRVTRPDAEAG